MIDFVVGFVCGVIAVFVVCTGLLLFMFKILEREEEQEL